LQWDLSTLTSKYELL
jgi:hypothetical protein